MSNFTNSPLVVYTKISPNKTSPRNHAIDTITIHCMAGNLTIESCGSLFALASRQASSNYGIGSDGRIGMYVEEKDRSWCTSSGANDNRAVTIEVANSEAKHPWPVSEAAYAALLDLVTDICRRNNIKKVLWKADKTLVGQVDRQNMTVHRWFAAKACPGDYLYERHGKLCDEVNRRLGTALTPAPIVTPPAAFTPYRVKVAVNALIVRKEPTTGSKVTTTIKNGGVYTIVEEASGAGAIRWGKLKSGAGWISLDYTKKI